MKRRNLKRFGVGAVDYGLMPTDSPLSPLQIGPQGPRRSFREAMVQAKDLAMGLNRQVFGGQGLVAEVRQKKKVAGWGVYLGGNLDTAFIVAQFPDD